MSAVVESRRSSANQASPSRKRGSKRVPIIVGSTLLLLTLAGAGALVMMQSEASTAASVAARVVEVRQAPLDVLLEGRGELQAVNNIEIFSRVEGRTTITEVAPEGSFIRKGEVLIRLDSSAIRTQIEDATLELQRAEASLTNAREALAIQISNNSAELEGAEVGLSLAEIDLRKYLEGTFPQQQANAESKLESARIGFQNKLDELSQARSLFNRGFVTSSEVKRKEIEVNDATNLVNQAQTDLRVLIDFTYPAEQARLQNAVAQAKNRLQRVKSQNESMLTQRQTDLNAAEQTFETRRRRLETLQAQFEACTITAPADGMVVYAPPRDGNPPIQVGAEVRERMMLVRLPDTTSMKAVLRLNEAQVVRVRPGMSASVSIVGARDRVNATLDKVSVLADSGGRWWDPDRKEFPIDLHLESTPEGLKPGVSVQASILIDSTPEATQVPLDAIYSAGPKTFVFVVGEQDKIEPREVKLGVAGAAMIEVVEGVNVGDRVLRLEVNEGKRLLEAAGIKLEEFAPSGSGRGEGERRRDRSGPNRGENREGPGGSPPPTTAPSTQGS